MGASHSDDGRATRKELRMTTTTGDRIRNYIGGEWTEPDVRATHRVLNPATGERLGETPLCGAAEVDAAARAAEQALQTWRRVPVEDPVQHHRTL
jgi:malonate-semialdehyde dehydrogenase (acetylating)/methylmalonate-semialdehyde dehydrogenase